jgi:hypothetical protein
MIPFLGALLIMFPLTNPELQTLIPFPNGWSSQLKVLLRIDTFLPFQ